MARFLYRLYQADRDEPGRLFHVRVLNPATAKASTDAAYLVHWDLVMKDGRGSYAITAKGRAFCQGSIRVPECLVLLCGEFECLDGLLISIEDALGQSIGELKL
jgi:tRNA G37 N-methylase TrmD